MSVLLSDAPDPVRAGGTLLYTVSVANNGPDPANARIDLPLPVGVTLLWTTTGSGWTVDSSTMPGVVTWSRATFPVGADTLTATVIVSASLADGSGLTAVATISAPGDPDGSNNLSPESTTVVNITPIHDIQGPGASSPIVGATVKIRGIVTGIASDGYFVQEENAEVDADPATSEGIFVATIVTPPAAAEFGGLVEVVGQVAEVVPPLDPQQPPRTQLFSATVSLLASGQLLPTAVPLTSTFPDPAGPFDQLERVEGMRVSVASMTAVGPTSGDVNEANATATSTGRFYGVVTGVSRPFREAGVRAPDTVPTGSIPPIPRWDGNPERLRVDSLGLAEQHAIEVKSGDLVTAITGPLDYSARDYAILPDGTTSIAVTPQPLPTTVAETAANEFTVASWNLQRFFNTVDDPGAADVPLTVPAYTNRLGKASLAIRQHLLGPDVIAVQEIENLGTLQDLATQIATDGGPNYQAFLVDSPMFIGLDLGFLVKSDAVSGGAPRVTVNAVTQFGADATWTNPITAAVEPLFTRPPLVLDAIVNGDAGGFPIVVLATQLESRDGIDSAMTAGPTTVGDRVRRHRQAQAEYLANAVQARQDADPGERLLLVGDFNASEWNDGYVDVMNVIAGSPAPDDQTVVDGDGVDLVEPNLANLVNTPATLARYSYVDAGNAQSVDHVLASAALVAATTARRIEHPRIGSDYPETERNNGASAYRVSNHDPVVAYFGLFGASPDVSVSFTNTQELVLPGEHRTYAISVVNASTGPATAVSLAGSTPGTTTLVSFTSPPDWSCSTPGLGAGGAISCSMASLAPGVATFELTVYVPLDTPLGTEFTNIVTVASPDDLTEENNSAATTAFVNDAPAIDDILDQSIAEDAGPLVVPFTYADFVPGTVAISATSSDQTIVPNANIAVSGSFFNRTLSVTPAPNQHGPVVITVTVHDGGASVSDTFTLDVAPVNDAPAIGNIANQSVATNATAGPVLFTIADIDTSAASLSVSGSSSNPALVPDGAITFGGSGATRSVMVKPLRDQVGNATITVTVSDGVDTAATTFVVQVTTPENQAPTLDGVVDVTIEESGTHTWPLTLGDDLTTPAELLVTATSSNQALLPNAALVFGGSGDARTLTLSPASEQSGQATVTVTVSDGELSTTRTALVTVAGAIVPEPPTTLSATVQNTTVTFTWQEATSGATPSFYVLEGGIAPGTTTLPVIVTPTRVTSWTQTLPAGIYFFRVRAANRVGLSTPSSDVRVIVVSPTPIAGSPTGFAMRLEGVNATASWNRPANGGAANWQIELGSSAGASERGVFVLPSEFTSASGSVAPGEYVARVRGVNAAGAGPASNELRVRVGALANCEPLAAPVLLPATVRDRMVTLGWRVPADATLSTYRLLLGSVPGAGDLAIVDLPAMNAFVATAPPGTYHVSVVATNGCHASAPSNPIVVDVPAIDPPANLRYSIVGANRVALLWSAVTGAQSYVLEAGAASGRRDLSLPVDTTGLTVVDVPAGTYYVRVRAVGPGGITGATSAEIVVVVQ